MQRWLVQEGIDAGRLFQEGTSVDTEENIENAKKIMDSQGYGGKEVVVVTTGFHLFRSDLIAERNGYTAYKLSLIHI